MAFHVEHKLVCIELVNTLVVRSYFLPSVLLGTVVLGACTAAGWHRVVVMVNIYSVPFLTVYFYDISHRLQSGIFWLGLPV